jgi:hypothetical protein
VQPKLQPNADFTDLIGCWPQKAAKPSLNGALQAENRMKPGRDQIAGHLVRHQKELILLVFCG